MGCEHEKFIRREWHLVCTSCFVEVEQIIGGDVPLRDLIGENSGRNPRKEKKTPITRILDNSKVTLLRRVKGGWGRKGDESEIEEDLLIFVKTFFEVNGEKTKFPNKAMVVELLAKRKGFPFRFNFRSTIDEMDAVARLINETRFEKEGIKLKEKGKCPFEKVTRTSEMAFRTRVKKKWGDEKDTQIFKRDFLIVCKKFFEVHGEDAKFPRKSFVIEKLARRRKLKCNPGQIKLDFETRLFASNLIMSCNFPD